MDTHPAHCGGSGWDVNMTEEKARFPRRIDEGRIPVCRMLFRFSERVKWVRKLILFFLIRSLIPFIRFSLDSLFGFGK